MAEKTREKLELIGKTGPTTVLCASLPASGAILGPVVRTQIVRHSKMTQKFASINSGWRKQIGKVLIGSSRYRVQ
eukprot:COSAG03_NODE_23314_length_281_cov_0.571429_1_plen_74_part_10